MFGLVACGGTAVAPPAAAPAATPVPAATRDPARDSLPLVADVSLGASAHTWQGADDHVTLSITNRGRDILDLVVQAPAWIDEHGLAMGSTRSCTPNLDTGEIDCGPVYAGQSQAVILRAYPANVGTFTYQLRVFDRQPSGLAPIAGADGRPIAFEFQEVVDPLTNQIPGGRYTPTPQASPGG